jgi:RND family efflux transporter MFP subunit
MKPKEKIKNAAVRIKDRFISGAKKVAPFFDKKILGLRLWVYLAVLVVAATTVGVVFVAHKDVSSTTVSETNVKTVRVMAVTPAGSDVLLSYVGTVEPEEIQNATYAGISKVEKIYVSEGDRVQKGDLLATVDSETAQSNLRSAETALNTAQAARQRAQIACDNTAANLARARQYEATEQTYEDAEAALAAATAERDALSASDPGYAAAQQKVDEKQAARDQALSDYNAIRVQKQAMDNIAQNNGFTDAVDYYEYELRLAQSTLDEANASYANAQSGYDSAAKALDDCLIRSELDGYVIMVYTKEGDICTPLAPIVVVGSEKTVVSVGTSATDIKDVKKGQTCDIDLNGQPLSGTIAYINMLPDSQSRTYETHITLPDSDTHYLIGDLASVKIHIGSKTGIWLPLSVILNDGQDYVFVVEAGRAMKKYIKITSISNDMVMVTGLDGGGYVVIEGMKSLKAGNSVKVIE